MPFLDDAQFERYLKGFRPLAPESPELEKRPSRARRPFVWMAWAAASAASLVLAFLFMHRNKPATPLNAPRLADSQSLTIGRANALLAHAPSVKEAFDEPSFQPHPASQLEGKQSALAALSEENIKL